MATIPTQEELRLQETQTHQAHWRRWGSYLSDRQWGTVREDYSPYGAAWDYFTHDQARSRAYRWGEDGLLGISDNHQRLCLGIAFLNMLEIALELAKTNPVYEDIATKFFEHYLYIADAMNHIGEMEASLWNEADGFYYDVLHFPDDRQVEKKV
jgi:hypothetical protein